MVFGRPREVSIAHPIALFSLMKGMRSLEGGLGVLTAALYEKVREAVRLSEPVKRVVIENGRVRGAQTRGGFVAAGLSEEERRRLVIRKTQRFFPKFPDEPVFTKLFRWDRAINLLSPAQFGAIQGLLKSHLRDVAGLHLAGEYLFPVACTEGALATGKAAAEAVSEELAHA